MAAITGDLSLTLADGAVLNDGTDIGLARQWAEHEHEPAEWQALSRAERDTEIAAALSALRSAYGQG